MVATIGEMAAPEHRSALRKGGACPRDPSNSVFVGLARTIERRLLLLVAAVPPANYTIEPICKCNRYCGIGKTPADIFPLPVFSMAATQRGRDAFQVVPSVCCTQPLAKAYLGHQRLDMVGEFAFPPL